MTAGVVTGVWSASAPTVAGWSGDNTSDPAHAPLMTGVAASRRHDAAVNHSRPAKRCRGLVAHVARNGGREVIGGLGHNPHTGIRTAMTSGACGDNPRMAHRPG